MISLSHLTHTQFKKHRELHVSRQIYDDGDYFNDDNR